jgi:hypothetical protein
MGIKEKIMWKVKWYNYCWNVEEHIISDETYKICISNEPDYYISAVKI